MKLSIWQQFSSNHSAAFSIVARFESAEKAKAVAAQVTEMLLETYRWTEYGLSEWDRNPSQIRQAFEQKVAFGTSWMGSEGHLQRALQVNGKEIYVSDAPGYSNFDGSDVAFIKIFEKFGADVIAAREEAGGFIFLNLSGDAVDEQAAQAVLGHILERKTYAGEIEYMHDFEKSYHSARAVRREETRVFFDNIFKSPHFEALRSWYTFMKAHALSNVILTLRHEPSMKSLEIELDETKFKQLMWHSLRYRDWADTAKQPRFALRAFESPADADNAASKIREILLSIQTWSRENSEESRWVWDAFWERLSPIESTLKAEYGIDWPMSCIEWIHYCKQAADFILIKIDKQVLLANRENTWLGIAPFDQLLEKLGAIHIERPSRTMPDAPRFNFEIIARSTEEAQQLWRVIERAVAEADYLWLAFYRNYQDSEHWRDDIEYLRLQNEAAKAYQDSLQTFIGYHNELKIEYGLTEFLQKVYTIPDLFDEHTLKMKAIVRDCEFRFEAIYSRYNILTIEGGKFEKAASLLGLEAFIAWLRSKNCEVKLT